MTDHDAAARRGAAGPDGRGRRGGVNRATALAAGVVAAAPLVVLVLVFQRRITAGLTSGSLKG